MIPARIQKRRETQERRAKMRRSIITLKIDNSHLTPEVSRRINKMLWESKLVWNYLINYTEHRIKKLSDWIPTNEIERYFPIMNVKDSKRGDTIGYFVQWILHYLPASVRNQIPQQMQSAIKGLSVLKKKKFKVGSLKFTKERNSLSFGSLTSGYWKIQDNQHIKLPGLPLLKVSGFTEQWNKLVEDRSGEDPELCTATLIKKPSGYYIHISVATDWKPICASKEKVGIDMGIKTAITAADKEGFVKEYNSLVPETPRLKKLQQKLSKQTQGSHRYNKTKSYIKKEYEKMTNKRNDNANRIVNDLCKDYKVICMQDENITGWKESGLPGFGKRVQHGVLGRVKAKIKFLVTQDRAIIIEQKKPTTKQCYRCGRKISIKLGENIFKCKCGHEEPRDIKAAKTMIYFAEGDMNKFEHGGPPANPR